MKDIPGFEGRYAVTEDGQVFSYRSKRFLAGETTRNGYHRVQLGGQKYLVHRLVAMTYIPNPEDKPCVNHKDCNRLNNNVNNLEWCTYEENNTYADRLEKSAAKHSRRVKQMTLDGEFIRYWDSAAEAGRELGISNVCRAANGTRKSAGGFRFEYVD